MALSYIVDLQSQINAYERQMAEIQVPFQRKGERKPTRICKGCPGRCWLPPAQGRAFLQEDEGFPEVELWFLYFIMSEGTVLRLRKEDWTVVQELGRNSRFSTWFDQILPVGHSQPCLSVPQTNDTSM